MTVINNNNNNIFPIPLHILLIIFYNNSRLIKKRNKVESQKQVRLYTLVQHMVTSVHEQEFTNRRGDNCSRPSCLVKGIDRKI